MSLSDRKLKEQIHLAEYRIKLHERQANAERRRLETLIVERERRKVSRQSACQVGSTSSTQTQVRTVSSASQTGTMVQEDDYTQAREIEAITKGLREQLWFGTD